MPWIEDFAGSGCLADPALSSQRKAVRGLIFAFHYRQPSSKKEDIPGSTRLRFALAAKGFLTEVGGLFPAAQTRMIDFTTEHDLRVGWNGLAASLSQTGTKAIAGAIFSHARLRGQT